LKNTSDTSGQTWTAGACNTFVCLDLKDEISQVWMTQPTNQYLSEGASVSIGPRVYFAGGMEEGDYFGGLDGVFVFNLETEKTEKIMTLSLPRSHLAAVAAGNKVIFAGGKVENGYNRGNPDVYDVVDIYDQQSGNMTMTRLSQPRAHMAAASNGEKAFFIGGLVSGTQSTARVDIYDASNGNWGTMELPGPRAYAGAVVSGGKLYVARGMDAARPGKPIYTVDVLDLASGSWSALEAPHAHPKASVVLADGKIFIAGGDLYSNRFVDIYDPASNTWASAELTDARNNITVAVLTDRIIFLGGSYSNAIDIYDLVHKTWIRGVVNLGVDGMMAGAWGNTAVFTGFKFDQGNSVGNVMFILRRL
jgi:N-acetylneuraminic acid mutarotase